MSQIFALDLETAALMNKDEPPNPSKVLGIACGCLLAPNQDINLWYATKPPSHGHHGPSLTKETASGFLCTIEALMSRGDTIVTWNGMFDFHVLGVESGHLSQAAHLATSSHHIDLMMFFSSIRRHRLGLKAAAAACGSHKGAEGLESGENAPDLWFKGEYSLVLSYLIQDCVATYDVYRRLELSGGFTWLTKSQKPQDFKIPSTLRHPRFWNVESTLSRSWEPAPSWVSDPLEPSDFLTWVPQ